MIAEPDSPPARRSDATRAAILEAARARFAAEGYRKATVRAIAADANIDPSMVMRYFGSKDGLFAAVLDITIDIPDLSAVDPDRMGEVLIQGFLDVWDEPPGNEVMLTLLRTAITDEEVAERARTVFAQQVMPAVLRYGDPADAPRRSGLIATQLLGLALCRHILRLPPVVAMPRTALTADLAPTLQRYLTS